MSRQLGCEPPNIPVTWRVRDFSTRAARHSRAFRTSLRAARFARKRGHVEECPFSGGASDEGGGLGRVFSPTELARNTIPRARTRGLARNSHRCRPHARGASRGAHTGEGVIPPARAHRGGYGLSSASDVRCARCRSHPGERLLVEV